MTAATLDFTDLSQRDAEWDGPDGIRYRFLDRSTGTGWHRWDRGAVQVDAEDGEFVADGWVFHGVMVHAGPFTRVPEHDEIGEWADEAWEIGC